MVNQAVYGIVNNRNKTEKLVKALVDAGVNPKDISILSSQSEEFKEFAQSHPNLQSIRNWRTEDRVKDYPAGTQPSQLQNARGNLNREPLGTEKHTKAPEGAATGGLTGGIIGGTLGLLAGIGALAIPGMGPFIAAGPIMAALSGIGAGGTLGGIIGSLIGAGIPEYEAKRFENRLREGGVLLAVRTDNENLAKEVKDILKQQGAEDVSISSEAEVVSRNYNRK